MLIFVIEELISPFLSIKITPVEFTRTIHVTVHCHTEGYRLFTVDCSIVMWLLGRGKGNSSELELEAAVQLNGERRPANVAKRGFNLKNHP